jgi:hypothetical protein
MLHRMIKFCQGMRESCKHSKAYSWSNKECVRCLFNGSGKHMHCSEAIIEDSNLFEQRIGQCEKCDNRYKCWTE